MTPCATIEAIKNPKCGFLFTANQNDFLKIAGSNLGYWCNNSLFELFGQNKLLSDRISTKQGMATADNAQFLRFAKYFTHKHKV